MKAFDLPAGMANESLKKFSVQSGLEVIFPTGVARRIRTPAVKGEFTDGEAMARLLEGSGLIAIRDEKSGAFTVMRSRDGNAPERAPPPPSNTVKKKSETPNQSMKSNKLLTTLAATLGLIAGPAAQAQVAPSTPTQPSPAETAVELSPFVVSADENESWLATSTLAGSRLNTPLRDTGASISVLTSEFLKDLGAIDLEDAVGYAVNIHMDTNEGTNVNDNWAMGSYDAARVKIRGVDATVTRNYFRWGIQSDSYNADRIEENRGPNSILFGIGSAGGVVNTLTKRASLSQDFRRGEIVIGSYDSYRGTVDINQRLLEGKLAVRLNAVYSEQGAFREHSYNDTQRVHLAATWKVRERSRFRIDYEIGEVKNVGSRPIPGYNGVGTWINAGSQTFETVQTANLGAVGLSRYNANQRRITFVENLGAVYNYQGQNRSTGNGDVILDENLVSFEANPVGPFNRRDANLQNLSVFWEEKLFEHTFMELSHNLQIPNRENFVVGQGRTENATLFADPLEILPDGSPNPNAGALFYEGGRWNRSINRQKSHNTRLMLSHEMDFGKWGNYRLAGLGEYEWRSETNRIYVEAWEGAPFNDNPENDQNQVWRRYYVTPGDWSTYHSGSGPRDGLLQNIPDPTTPGRMLNSTWVPFNQNQLDSYERQTTMLLGGHARYFDGRLVLGAGFRKDDLEIRLKQPLRDPVTNAWTLDHPDVAFNKEKYSGNTRTLGAVGHLTRNISVFYNFSNSIDIPNTTHRILPDGRIPPTSEAKGQDFGVGFSFFDGKLAGRANRFTVDMIGATGGGFGGTLDSPQVLNNRVLSALA